MKCKFCWISQLVIHGLYLQRNGENTLNYTYFLKQQCEKMGKMTQDHTNLVTGASTFKTL